MHPEFEKDYRYLLQRLIPRNLLSSERLEGIRRALDSGDRFAMIRAAYLSLEELCSKEVFRRDGITRSDNTTSISYVKVAGRMRITLEIDRGELGGVRGEVAEASGILPSVLAGIISSLALNNSSKAVIDRLGEILALVGRILTGSEAFLILLKEPPFPAERAGDRIKVTDWSELSANRFYRSCITSGLSHTFMRLSGAFPGESFFAVQHQTKSIILIPIHARDVKWGILEIHLTSDTSPAKNVFLNIHLLGQGIIRLLENNIHLENMVSIDRLTQAHNRNYYETQLPLEMERATRNKKCLAFLMIDIDDFKQVNDAHGHDVGDNVLKTVVQTVKSHLRKIDLFFRFGGEEFIALLPGAGKEAAQRTAERIRDVISKTGTTLDDGKELRVTISIGGCIYPVDAQSEIELLRNADQAMYISKREGKNRTTFYEE